MRPRTLLLGVVLALVTVPVLLALWPDQPLEPQVIRTLEIPPRLPARPNLFNHVVGLAVAAEEDPAQTAYDAVTRVNGLLAGAPGEVDPQQLSEEWVAEALALSDPGKVLCSAKEGDCVSRLWTSRGDVAALAAAHPVLIRRYLAMSSAPEHRMELLPHLSVPFPTFVR